MPPRFLYLKHCPELGDPSVPLRYTQDDNILFDMKINPSLTSVPLW
jgi:hypothetical protein